MRTFKRVLVTGANGLLGTNTIIELLNQGYKVTGFLRDKNRYVGYEHKNLTLIEGDITNFADLEAALKNCDSLIHCAALTDPKANHVAYENINLRGTKKVVQAAIKMKLKKFVFVSTANVCGFGPKNDPGSETQAIKKPFSDSSYSISKKKAQDYVLSMTSKIEVVVVNPSFMIGPYDSKPSSGKIILHGLNKRIVLYPPGGKSFVCVEDVALGIVKALKKGATGETYLLTNENMSYRAFFNLLKKKTQSQQMMLPIPKSILFGLGFLGDLARYFGFRTQFSSNNMKALCSNVFYVNSKAKNDLGMVFTPVDKGVEDAIAWFQKNKVNNSQ
ncbi:NAD-dependent epimerase/dehydratase family protein [Gaetbulibacter sp. M240]|uniref:NAD-dependent epimerase/dehydratase family protein n=1 Tax=Gaetbulibacter sp. M240 TaxID=3126511 RepID=UPI00374E5B18